MRKENKNDLSISSPPLITLPTIEPVHHPLLIPAISTETRKREEIQKEQMFNLET